MGSGYPVPHNGQWFIVPHNWLVCMCVSSFDYPQPGAICLEQPLWKDSSSLQSLAKQMDTRQPLFCCHDIYASHLALHPMRDAKGSD